MIRLGDRVMTDQGVGTVILYCYSTTIGMERVAVQLDSGLGLIVYTNESSINKIRNETDSFGAAKN